MELVMRSFDSMFDRPSSFSLFIIPFEMLSVAKRLKLNRDCCDEKFVKIKEQFEKHSIPLSHLSNITIFEATVESSNIEKALLHFRNDVFGKTENKHLLMQIPVSQFSNKHSVTLTLLQRST
jgi:hypothetical protein